MLPTIQEDEIMSYRITIDSVKSYLPATEILPTKQYRFKNKINIPKVLIVIGIILMAAIMIFAIHE